MASGLTLNQRKIATLKLALREQNAKFLMHGHDIILVSFFLCLKTKKGLNKITINKNVDHKVIVKTIFKLAIICYSLYFSALICYWPVSLVSNKEMISGPMQPAAHFPVELGCKWSIQVHLLPSITQLPEKNDMSKNQEK